MAAVPEPVQICAADLGGIVNTDESSGSSWLIIIPSVDSLCWSLKEAIADCLKNQRLVLVGDLNYRSSTHSVQLLVRIDPLVKEQERRVRRRKELLRKLWAWGTTILKLMLTMSRWMMGIVITVLIAHLIQDSGILVWINPITEPAKAMLYQTLGWNSSKIPGPSTPLPSKIPRPP